MVVGIGHFHTSTHERSYKSLGSRYKTTRQVLGLGVAREAHILLSIFDAGNWSVLHEARVSICRSLPHPPCIQVIRSEERSQVRRVCLSYFSRIAKMRGEAIGYTIYHFLGVFLMKNATVNLHSLFPYSTPNVMMILCQATTGFCCGLYADQIVFNFKSLVT